jgi:ribose-phosphate pyrophosphokinase
MLQAAGADRVVSVDLHTGQIQGFFDIPVDHLTAQPVLIDYVRRNVEADPVIVSPDAGGMKAAKRFSHQLGADLAFVNKYRPKGTANTVVAADVIGHVKGRACILLDDMIDTAGTIVAAADILREHGATDVWVMATHAVLSDPATDRLKNADLSRVVVTDTLPIPPSHRFDKLEVLSVAGLVGDAIDAVFEDTSVSEIFDGANQS